MSATPPSMSTDLKWAPRPFDKPTADVILQSSDNVHFRVRKGILAEASSVFDDLFTYATPAPNASLRCGDEMIDGVPVIALEETSSVLTFILHPYYPPYEVQHTLDNLDDALGAMTASHKYMMPYAQKVANKRLALVAESNPIRAYAVACKRGMTEAMAIAAKTWLGQPLAHNKIAELADITAMDYLNLLEYREACSLASALVASPSGPTNTLPKYPWLTAKWFLSEHRYTGYSMAKIQISGDVSLHPPENWFYYMKTASEALAKRPSSKVIFEAPLSKQLLEALSGRIAAAADPLNEILSFQNEFAAAVDAAIDTISLSTIHQASEALRNRTT